MGNASEVGEGWKLHELLIAEITGRFHVEMSQIKNIYRPVYVCVGAGELLRG